MNIMFTCAGRRVALMNAFRNALVELGVKGKIIATDVTSASPAFHKADVGIAVCPAGRIEYVPELLEIVKKYDVKLVVPLTDIDLRSLARQRDKFTECGCLAMIGSEQTVSLCRDKARTNALLAKIGLASIRTCTLNEFRSQPFYPCFVKPIRGSASIGTGVIQNDKELQAHVATFGDLLIVQEYVPGQEFTVDIYRARSGHVKCVVPRQRLIVRSGEVEKGITVRDEQVMRDAKKLAEALDDIWGVFCCQCRRDADGPPRFFEINPRFGGGAPLSIAAGADLPLYVLQDALNMPVTAEVGKFKENLLMLRYDDAVFVEAENLDGLPGYENPEFR